MERDFGSGLTVDELIGMTAYQITHLTLPPGDIFEHTFWAASVLEDSFLESCILLELWGDGHTVWQSAELEQPIWVTPSGQVRHIH